MTSETRICQNCKSAFVIEPEDFDFYKKMEVPPPTWCPECRLKRRMIFRNERTLHKLNCGLCSDSILSNFNPSSGHIVYCQKCFHSDKWDPRSSALPYRLERPFFKQLQELFKIVPKSSIPIAAQPNINSDYAVYASGNKNCYLVSNIWDSEDSAYSRGIRACKGVFDVYYASNSERVWESINIHRSSEVFYCQNVTDSLGMYYSTNSTNCQNCFGCVNLRNKKYCFFNEQLTKEEWNGKVEEVLGSYIKMEDARRSYEALRLKFPQKENSNFKVQNSDGEYIFESNNVHDSFEMTFCENVRYGFSNSKLSDSSDTLGFGTDGELIYESVTSGASSRIIGCYSAVDSLNCLYSFDLRHCKNCFGCDGLRSAEYCILNTQYSKDEYGKFAAKITQELKDEGLYGNFLPYYLSPFSYNESVAQNYFPLAKEEAEAKGYPWRERTKRSYDISVKANDLPDIIQDATTISSDDIIECLHNGACKHQCIGAFRLIPMELDFYRKHRLPLPRLCPACRFQEKIERKPPLHIYERRCECIGPGNTKGDYNNIASHRHGSGLCEVICKTAFSPTLPETIYCESCYNSEVA